MEQISEQTVQEHLHSAVAALGDMPRVTLNEAQAIEVRHGRPISVSAVTAHRASKPQAEPNLDVENHWAAVDQASQLVAILKEKHAGQLWPTLNLI
jgi:hypothetical protein